MKVSISLPDDDVAFLVVSNDGANTTAPRLGIRVVTVAPLTPSISRVYPFQILVSAQESG
ncbi:MAG TPA: hypothetical protein VLA29_13055 [Acidimicrobiia bacterium]|nr:hypothetical protein [Acidimicrobiia bacterium]